MSILLSCRNISKCFSTRPLFEGLSFGLFENERTGLIGPNGAGKSTLLKILAGLEKPDSGELVCNRGLRVKYLSQQDVFDNTGDLIVRDELVRALQDIGLEDWEIDIRVDEGLENTGFNPDQKVQSLSGGWRKRLAILGQVLCQPDLLLLDEPTNHLDLEGVLWLEKFLNDLPFSFLMISHDRRFLESVSNRVIELNKQYENGHFSSVGNYSDFIESREKLFSAQQQQEQSTRNIVKQEIDWLRRGPKARTTKQKARIDRAGELIDDLKELTYRNSQSKTASIKFSSSERRTKKLIECTNIGKTRGGKKLFGSLDLIMGPGDKLGLLGGNGSGKSTLLKLLSGDLQPDAGTIKRAEDLRVVTFDQHREQLDMDWPLRRALCESGDKVEFKGNFIHVAGWASRFLFNADQLDKPLKSFSGGEQSRVLIARLMLKPADILLLDEPTNDLDINSLDVLEKSMMDFSGAMILVTHDRYLLDRVCKQILSLDGKGNTRYFADLDQWEDQQQEGPISQEPVQGEKKPDPKTNNSLSKKEAKELRSLEGLIKKVEAEREKSEAALSDPAISTDAAELIKRQEFFDAASKNLENLMARWEELESKRT